MTCAICLEQIQLENTAYVKGCEHAYCGTPSSPLWFSIGYHILAGRQAAVTVSTLIGNKAVPAVQISLLSEVFACAMWVHTLIRAALSCSQVHLAMG